MDFNFSGVFTQWNNGLWNTAEPYNLENVQVPVSLLYGENDLLTEKTVSQLKKTYKLITM